MFWLGSVWHGWLALYIVAIKVIIANNDLRTQWNWYWQALKACSMAHCWNCQKFQFWRLHFFEHQFNQHTTPIARFCQHQEATKRPRTSLPRHNWNTTAPPKHIETPHRDHRDVTEAFRFAKSWVIKCFTWAFHQSALMLSAICLRIYKFKFRATSSARASWGRKFQIWNAFRL